MSLEVKSQNILIRVNTLSASMSLVKAERCDFQICYEERERDRDRE
jgi:hypothetical protein